MKAKNEIKVYEVSIYPKTGKEHLGLTIKSRSNLFIAIQQEIRDLMVKGDVIKTELGDIKVIDTSEKKALKNVLVQIDDSSSEASETAEIKIHNPGTGKKKSATIELRKTSDSDFEVVESVKDILISIIDEKLDKVINLKENKFKCKDCQWESKSELALKGHVRRVHTLGIGGSGKVTCNKCEKEFSSNLIFNTHKKFCHENRQQRKRNNIDFKCTICNSVFSSKEGLNAHNKSQHEETSNGEELNNSILMESPPRKKTVPMNVGNENIEIVDKEIPNSKLKSDHFGQIAKLEAQVVELLDKKRKDEIKINNLRYLYENLQKSKNQALDAKISMVKDPHIPLLKGFKQRYNTIPNGACLENAIAVHVMRDETKGDYIKRQLNNHIADNIESVYIEKITFPYEEKIGVGKNSKVVEIQTKEDFLKFLRSDDSLKTYSNTQELLAAATLYNMKINVFSYKDTEGNWLKISTVPELVNSEAILANTPDMFLYNEERSHYDLLVKDDDICQKIHHRPEIIQEDSGKANENTSVNIPELHVDETEKNEAPNIKADALQIKCDKSDKVRTSNVNIEGHIKNKHELSEGPDYWLCNDCHNTTRECCHSK